MKILSLRPNNTSVDQEALNDVSIDSVEADDVDLITEGEGEGSDADPASR